MKRDFLADPDPATGQTDTSRGARRQAPDSKDNVSCVSGLDTRARAREAFQALDEHGRKVRIAAELLVAALRVDYYDSVRAEAEDAGEEVDDAVLRRRAERRLYAAFIRSKAERQRRERAARQNTDSVNGSEAQP